MTRQVFPNDMVAHVWAQGRQDSGRSGNGNLFFEGPALFSYGRHYVAAYRLGTGRALINGDSYSVSTARHVSKADRAVSWNGRRVPDLTALARILESGRMADYRAEARTPSALELAQRQARDSLTRWAAGEAFPAPFKATAEARAELASRAATSESAARIMAQPLTRSAMASAVNRVQRNGAPAFPSLDPLALGWAFESLGLDPMAADKAARAALKARDRNAARWAEAEAAARLADQLETAKRWAAKTPAELAADLAAVPRSGNFSADYCGRVWGERSRELFRAQKAAKAKGWTRIAADLGAKRKAILAAVKFWQEAESLIMARKAARCTLAEAKAARGLLAARTPAELSAEGARLESTFKGWAGGTYAAAVAQRGASAFAALARAAEGLADTTSQHLAVAGFRRAFGPLGFNRAEVAAGFRAKAERLAAIERKANAAGERAKNRADLAAVRAFRAAEAAGEVAKATAKAALDAILRHEDSRAHGVQPFSPFRIAGWTYQGLESERLRALRAVMLAEEREKAAKDSAVAAYRAEAAEAWRNGQPMPPRPAGLGYVPGLDRLADSMGGALLRAEAVTRDESGQIDGGRLKTSWGAEVPLTHAIRAFRFLSKVRAEGQGWAANGRSLPVGHFRVDSIDPAGNFKAGCHLINWQEVARVAGGLGLADLAPADTTESTAAL